MSTAVRTLEHGVSSGVILLTRDEPLPVMLQGLPLPLRLMPARRLSADELLRFCASVSDLRVEQEPDGALIIMSPTGSETGRRNQRLSLRLGNWALQDDTGESFDSNTGFTLPDESMRSPDASWILRSRWELLTEEERRRFAPICPEFVVELVSPTDPLPEVRRKLTHWMRNGVQLGWLIDPDRKIVEVYRRGVSKPEVIAGAESVSGEGPVAGFVLDLREIWG